MAGTVKDAITAAYNAKAKDKDAVLLLADYLDGALKRLGEAETRAASLETRLAGAEQRLATETKRSGDLETQLKRLSAAMGGAKVGK